jgi:hypothetical protein
MKNRNTASDRVYLKLVVARQGIQTSQISQTCKVFNAMCFALRIVRVQYRFKHLFLFTYGMLACFTGFIGTGAKRSPEKPAPFPYFTYRVDTFLLAAYS